MTVEEDIAALAQDAAIAPQNNINVMRPTGLDQVVVVVVAPLLLMEEDQDPGPRTVMPRGPGLLMLPQPKG